MHKYIFVAWEEKLMNWNPRVVWKPVLRSCGVDPFSVAPAPGSSLGSSCESGMHLKCFTLFINFKTSPKYVPVGTGNFCQPTFLNIADRNTLIKLRQHLLIDILFFNLPRLEPKSEPKPPSHFGFRSGFTNVNFIGKYLNSIWSIVMTLLFPLDKVTYGVSARGAEGCQMQGRLSALSCRIYGNAYKKVQT